MTFAILGQHLSFFTDNISKDSMSKQIIIFEDASGLCVLYPILECGLSVEEIAKKDAPEGLPYNIIEASTLPDTFKFRSAWRALPELAGVKVDLETARLVAQQLRRLKRQMDLEPLDAQVNYSIGNPEKLAELEEQREAIRIANAALQISIDAATTTTELDELTAFAGVHGMPPVSV